MVILHPKVKLPLRKFNKKLGPPKAKHLFKNTFYQLYYIAMRALIIPNDSVLMALLSPMFLGQNAKK